MKKFTLCLLCLTLASSAFAQPMNQVVCSFSHKVGSEPLVLHETLFSIWNGKTVVLSRAEFYLSEMELLHTNGAKTPLTDQYLLVNANASGVEFDLGEWPVDGILGMTLHVGVPQSVNHNDPAAWPDKHPLAPKNPSMHWGWAAGYIFLVVEGRVDNDGDGVPETPFQFHNIDDILDRSAQVLGTKTAENGQLLLNFTLDYAQLLKGVPLETFLIMHGASPLNQTIMDNAATQGFLALSTASSSQTVSGNSQNVRTAPNPANSETWISYDLPATGPLHLTVTNVLGQTVHTDKGLPPVGTMRLQTATLPEGIFLCAFYENGQLLARKKLVVRH